MTALLAETLSDALPGCEVVRGQQVGEDYWLVSGGAAPDFRLLEVEGEACRWHPERPQAIADALDRAAPLLERVEAVTGWRLEPTDLLARAPRLAILIREEGTVLQVALDPDAPAPAALLAAAAGNEERPSDRPIARLLQAQGPRLSIEQAAGLAPGDLLLLPSVLRVGLAGDDELPLSLDLQRGHLGLTRWSAPEPGGLAVALVLTLPPVRLSEDEISRLAEGGELDLGLFPADAPVAFASAGRSLGEGQLTRLGEAHAILISALHREEPAA